MPSLLDELTERYDERPWGIMHVLDAKENNVTVKYLVVEFGARTSLQWHDFKDEILLVCSGSGYVEIEGTMYPGIPGCKWRIKPGTRHRVHGPLTYLEVSTYDDGTDTIRLEDDYGRTT